MSHNTCLGKKFVPTFDIFIKFECSSDVRTPKFGEMKERCLTLAERRLYKNEFLANLSRVPFLSAFKSLPYNYFLYSHGLAKVKCIAFVSPKLGVGTSVGLVLSFFRYL